MISSKTHLPAPVVSSTQNMFKPKIPNLKKSKLQDLCWI